MEAESCVLLVGGQAMGTGVAGASAGRVLVLPRPGLGRWALVSACNFFLLSLREKKRPRDPTMLGRSQRGIGFGSGVFFSRCLLSLKVGCVRQTVKLVGWLTLVFFFFFFFLLFDLGNQ